MDQRKIDCNMQPSVAVSPPAGLGPHASNHALRRLSEHSTDAAMPATNRAVLIPAGSETDEMKVPNRSAAGSQLVTNSLARFHRSHASTR